MELEQIARWTWEQTDLQCWSSSEAEADYKLQQSLHSEHKLLGSSKFMELCNNQIKHTVLPAVQQDHSCSAAPSESKSKNMESRNLKVKICYSASMKLWWEDYMVILGIGAAH